ncbi:MAG: GNAT family N-acetyltransferase [Saprospiraceae bacterium]
MKISTLENVTIDQLIDCFLACFANYFVPMPTDRAYYKTRWKNANVRFDYSYGVFDDDKLVGFIINAIDERNGHRLAYNTGTGVLPAYRGKRLVKSIYEYAIPDLKKKGITKCSLEVITENIVAVNAYQSIGLAICKHYKCFKGTIQQSLSNSVQLIPKDLTERTTNDLADQSKYSYDNHYQSLVKGAFKYYELQEAGAKIGYFIINPTNGYLAQFELSAYTPQNQALLTAAVSSIGEQIRINNVGAAMDNKINWLEAVGLKNTVDQYEMEMIIQ